jgi:predicted  nucleic acid-binding Zn-ribbon protein
MKIQVLNREWINPLKNTRKYSQIGERNKTVQHLKMEIEATKKTQTEAILDMENLRKRTGTTDAIITNRIQEMEDRISGIEYKIVKINASVKRFKSKKFLTKNTREIWDIMKRPNLRIIGIEERFPAQRSRKYFQ